MPARSWRRTRSPRLCAPSSPSWTPRGSLPGPGVLPCCSPAPSTNGCSPPWPCTWALSTSTASGRSSSPWCRRTSGTMTPIESALATLAAVVLAALLVVVIAWQANRSMRARERLYHDLVANSFGLICTHDREGVLLMINPAAAEGLGYSPEELEGKNLRELLAPSTRDAFDKYLERVRSG